MRGVGESAEARPGSSMMEGEDGEQFICAQCGAAANQRCTGRDTENMTICISCSVLSPCVQDVTSPSIVLVGVRSLTGKFTSRNAARTR